MKTAYVDYQQRASEFSVGDLAIPLGVGVDEPAAGRIVAVYPAIGMVDLEFPYGPGRYPVEDLQRITGINVDPPQVGHDNTPGGAGTVSVPGGPVPSTSVDRVAKAYVKKAIYWASKDRRYRATQSELGAGGYTCPKCKETNLRPVRYKRRGGRSEALMACPTCLFLVKPCDIIGHPEYVEYVETPETPEPSNLSSMDQGFESVRNVEAGGVD